MRRLLGLVGLAALIASAALVADYPGTVEITWQGWLIDMPVGMLAAGVAAAAVVLWGIISLITALVRLPHRFQRNRRERRRRAGELALTRGIVALSAGDGPGAQRYARRAAALLDQSPLAQMLTAQAAQLDGDETEAKRRYLALLDQPEGEFLGLRGLIAQALRTGDSDEALRLAERAGELRPNAAWVFETLLALQIRGGRWEAARDTLTSGAKRHLLPAARADHHRGVILYELSFAAEVAGEARRALALAATAHSLARELGPLAVRPARLLLAAGRRRAARRAVEHAWQVAPHPNLAQIWGELGEAAPALERVTWFQRLAAQNPGASESHIAVAEAALAAQLWGEARHHLGQAVAAAEPAPPSRRLCRLMARLEEGEHGAIGRSREWLDRALGAAPDAVYVCARCGNETADWQSLCGHCQGFDTLAWRTPPLAAAPAAMAPAVETIAAGPLLSIPSGTPPSLAAAGQSDR
jgi:HemY protein